MGGRDWCSQAVYTVDDEGLEEDGTVGGGASQLVNHSYSRRGTSGEATRASERYGRREDSSDGHGEGEEVRLEDKKEES